ncbi:DUF2339 domain-containing protein [Candidatus Pacebacteria bacterium]|nr:DUF2339 domain-containing protein [Candidatus Paceibacterota bacterium]
MEIFVVLLFLIPLFMFFYPLYVGNKVKKLEQRINQLEAGKQPVTSEHPTVDPSVAQDVTQSEMAPQAQPPTPSPQANQFTPQSQYVKKAPHTIQPNAFIEWLKQDFFVKLGAFLLLLALGWFVSYAFANNWIGPAGRIALGLLLGAAFLGGGVWRMKNYIHQGGIFTVLGATTVLLTVFAAREIYDFFTPLSSLALMFATVVFVTFVSLRYQSDKLALAGLILGSIAPLFTNAPVPDVAGLFTYLLIVAVGTLWVVARTGWSMLTFTSLLIAFLYSLPFLADGITSTDKDIALLFSFIFVGLFFVANIVSLIKRQAGSHSQSHMFTAIGTAIYLIVWVQVAAGEQWQSLLYVVWAMVFSVGTFLVYRFTKNQIAFYLYGGTSIALIGAATAAELQGAVLTIAFILEIGVLLFVATFLRVETQILTRLSLLFAVPGLLSLESFIASSWGYGIFHNDFVVLLLMALALLVIGVFISSKQDDQSIPQILITVSAVYIVSLVWLSFHALFTYDVGTTLSLVVYTISGLTLFAYGKIHDVSSLRMGGAVLVALVIGRLLLVEVWNMSLGGKIITFFVIGILLMSTAFIRKSSKGETDNQQTNITS